MKTRETINIFDYTDYRKYLHDYYVFQKARKSCFSYRYFAQKAGYNSSGLYKDIVSGRTGINHDMIAKFVRGLGLNRKEERYFECLVYFNQAGDSEDKKRNYEQMLKFRESPLAMVRAEQYEFYSKWYYSAVRELLMIMPFKDDYKELAKKLNPSITPGQAEKAIALLKKMEMIETGKDGYLKPCSALISTGDEVNVKSMNVANFQLQMMDLAKEAIARCPSEKRDISSLTLSVSEEVFLEMKSELQALRKKFMTAAQGTPEADRVYQLNLQLFPLTGR